MTVSEEARTKAIEEATRRVGPARPGYLYAEGFHAGFAGGAAWAIEQRPAGEATTLDPKPWRDIYTGARFARQNMLTLGYEFSPGPGYVQDRVAYEGDQATVKEPETLRERLEKALRPISFRVGQTKNFGVAKIPVEFSAVDLWKAIDAVLAVLEGEKR